MEHDHNNKVRDQEQNVLRDDTAQEKFLKKITLTKFFIDYSVTLQFISYYAHVQVFYFSSQTPVAQPPTMNYPKNSTDLQHN